MRQTINEAGILTRAQDSGDIFCFVNFVTHSQQGYSGISCVL